MKYLVIEIHPAYCVVLDENGQLIKVAISIINLVSRLMKSLNLNQ